MNPHIFVLLLFVQFNQLYSSLSEKEQQFDFNLPVEYSEGKIKSLLRRSEVIFLHYNLLEKVTQEKCFTQGLELFNGKIIQSCGLYGKSKVLIDGNTVYEFPEDEFAEGLTIIPNQEKIIVLTWREKKIYTINYKASDFTIKKINSYSYPYEGWGIAYNPDEDVLYTTDGSSTLRILQSSFGFSLLNACDVQLDGEPVNYLNELEYVQGLLFANILMYPGDDIFRIVIIDPIPNKNNICNVVAIWVLDNLHKMSFDNSNEDPEDVMNGIAYIKDTEDEFLLTGKNWGVIYKVRLKIPQNIKYQYEL